MHKDTEDLVLLAFILVAVAMPMGGFGTTSPLPTSDVDGTIAGSLLVSTAGRRSISLCVPSPQNIKEFEVLVILFSTV
jgi:hypothetical protein